MAMRPAYVTMIPRMFVGFGAAPLEQNDELYNNAAAELKNNWALVRWSGSTPVDDNASMVALLAKPIGNCGRTAPVPCDLSLLDELLRLIV